MDNVFIERLWRSLKYECVYLNAFETGGEAKDSIGRWIVFFDERRPHSTFGGKTQSEVYVTKIAAPGPGSPWPRRKPNWRHNQAHDPP